MKALTLRQPWAYAICALGKRVENRTWAPPATVLGEFIAIHAGQKYEIEATAWMWKRRLITEAQLVEAPAAPRGAIVAVARVSGWVGDECDDPWYVGPKAWILFNVHVLDRPLPAIGRQRMWELTPKQEQLVRASLPPGTV